MKGQKIGWKNLLLVFIFCAILFTTIYFVPTWNVGILVEGSSAKGTLNEEKYEVNASAASEDKTAAIDSTYAEPDTTMSFFRFFVKILLLVGIMFASIRLWLEQNEV